jgi:DNA-binding transcriptional LysR family regulator
MLETNLKRQIREIKNEACGKLCIGVPTMRMRFILPQLLPDYIKQYPHVELNIIEAGSTNMAEMVNKAHVDLAFIAVSPGQIALHNTNEIHLYKEYLSLFVSPETKLFKRIPPFTPIEITEAEDELFISLRVGHGIRAIQDRMFSDNKINPPILLEIKNAEAAIQLAFACGAVTLYPRSPLISESGKDPKYPYYPIIGEKYARYFSLCYNKNLYLPKYMSDFINMSVNLCSEV